METNQVSGIIVDSAMKVHSALGPGLLESAYEMCLIRELRKRGLRVESQVPIAVHYDGETLDVGYRADLLVEDGCWLNSSPSRWCYRSTRPSCFRICG
jgi:GxxExxY protein